LESPPLVGTEREDGAGRKKKADVVLSVNVNLSAADGKGAEEVKRVEEWLPRAVGSLRVDDWNLFGDIE
jgi:hypothetical protein